MSTKCDLLSSLFVCLWVSFEIEDTTPIFDLLIHVLLFFLGVAADERWVTVGVVVLPTRAILLCRLALLGGEGVSLGVTWPLLVDGGALCHFAVKSKLKKD